MEIKKLIENYLIITGADGLMNMVEGCQCLDKELFKCDNNNQFCKIAIKHFYDSFDELCFNCEKKCRRNKNSWCMMPK